MKVSKLLDNFLEVANQDVSAQPELKSLFHRRGKTLLKQIAADLGYLADDFDLRSNKAGIAVSGEITLHTHDLYIQFSQNPFSPKPSILYRSCQGRQDYTGGANHFMPFKALLDYQSALTKFASVRKQPRFFTQQEYNQLLANGQETAKTGEDSHHQPIVKLFTPDAGCTWLLSEIDPKNPDIAFGLCDLGMGFPELGYVSISELTQLRGKLGLPVERDRSFEATKTLLEYAKEASIAERIIA